jgi:hypothetical protein
VCVSYIIHVNPAFPTAQIIIRVADIIECEIFCIECVGKIHIRLTACIIGCFSKDIAIHSINELSSGEVDFYRGGGAARSQQRRQQREDRHNHVIRYFSFFLFWVDLLLFERFSNSVEVELIQSVLIIFDVRRASEAGHEDENSLVLVANLCPRALRLF